MPQLLLVMIGGAIGAGLRFEVGRLALRQLGPAFPWGTLVVNLVGGLLMGALAAMIVDARASQAGWLLLGTGVLGGFTTFSAFSLDLFEMLGRGELAPAFGYLLLSVVGALLLLALGFLAARWATA